MSKAMQIGFIEGSMAVIRQWNKVDAMKILLPQRIEDGKLINANGKVIGSWDAEDREIFPAERLETQRVTEALLNDVFTPINELMGTAGKRAKASDDEDEDEAPESTTSEEAMEEDEAPATSPEKDKKKSKKDSEDIAEAQDELIVKIETAVSNGKPEKAKKLLKAAKESLDKATYKKLKKLVKGE